MLAQMGLWFLLIKGLWRKTFLQNAKTSSRLSAPGRTKVAKVHGASPGEAEGSNLLKSRPIHYA